MIVNGKTLTPGQTRLYMHLMETKPEFKDKVEHLASGNSLRKFRIKESK